MARSLLVVAVAGSLLGCTRYEPDPFDPVEIVRELDVVHLRGLSQADVAPVVTSLDVSDGLTLLEASAVAVRRNPSLAALRAEVGVAEARLVQAGLLSDPVIGWDAMDAAAGSIIDGKIEGSAWTAGFGLTWQVPRPGEIDAKEGVARASMHSSAARLAGAEWSLVRDVQLAYVRLLVTRARREQVGRLAEIARRTLDYFTRARDAGAATALEAALARVAADNVRADALVARNGEVQARQALNNLMGLPPGHLWQLQDSLARFAISGPHSPEDPQRLVIESLERRPDLQEVLADYRQAEERLRLEVARQWPQLEIGTSFSLQIPIFSQLNAPAIRTATRGRDAARLRARTAVQRTRAEIHAALARSKQAHAVLELFQTSLGPQTEETLRLTERAFKAREVTPLQILTAQRQVLDTQSRFLAARQSWAEARVRLDSACGRLLPSARTPLPLSSKPDQEDSP